MPGTRVTITLKVKLAIHNFFDSGIFTTMVNFSLLLKKKKTNERFQRCEGFNRMNVVRKDTLKYLIG